VVRVVEGPFAPFHGAIEKIKMCTIDGIDSSTRLSVAVNIFGRLTPTELGIDQVEPVDTATL